jgi:hypothetical protein
MCYLGVGNAFIPTCITELTSLDLGEVERVVALICAQSLSETRVVKINNKHNLFMALN